MKKFVTIGFVLFSLQLIAQNDSVSCKTNRKTPEIIFKYTLYNYGTIKKGGNGIHEFEYCNTGKGSLIITNVESSCGCTVPEWNKEPVMRKKQGKIKVKYDTNIVGPFLKTITVHSNAKNTPVKLKIRGVVVEK